MKQHALFEQFSAKWLATYHASGRQVHCCAGCSGCCHLAVHATYPEAVAVAEALSAHQSSRLSEYVERLKNALPQLTDLKSYLKNHRQALGPCPFLDEDGACSIYAARPLACRALLSTRPAAWCTVYFSELDQWDKESYERGLDLQVVAWPTHYVAATQAFARELESSLLAAMVKTHGWSMAGNFAVMVWLEQKGRFGRREITTGQLDDFLTVNGLDNPLLLNLRSGQTVV